MDALLAIFGLRVQTLRKARGLTQHELGKSAGIDYKHLGGIERGTNIPSFEAIAKIANSLKVEYYELFLPNRLVDSKLDRGLQTTLKRIDKLDAQAVRAFFHELLVAVRKLEMSGGESIREES